MTSRSLVPVLLAALARRPPRAGPTPGTPAYCPPRSRSTRRSRQAGRGSRWPTSRPTSRATGRDTRRSSWRCGRRLRSGSTSGSTRGAAPPGRERFSRVLFHPYPGVWLRAAIPVALLAKPPATGNDMAAVGNRSRAGYFLGLWGPFVPLTDVEAIGFEMEKPIGSPTLEVRSIRLERKSPGDAVLDGLPLVDELGQSVHDSWPGKARSVEDLRAAWREEERALAPGDSGLCRYGGFVGTKAEATGFFRVEKKDGRWWFVDPDGHLFLSLGADVIRPEMVTPAAGREAFFRERPAAGRPPRARAGRRPRRLVPQLEPAAPLRRGLDLRLDRPDAAPDGRVGPQHGRQLERREAVGGEAQALRDPARELADRGELPGPSRRVLRRVREGGRRAGAPAVRGEAGRSLAARLLPGQRAALPAEGAADGGAHPLGPGDRDASRPREVARRLATPRSGGRSSSATRSTATSRSRARR